MGTTYNGKLNSMGRSELWTYCILILTSSLAALVAVNNIVISADSMVYGMVSQQIASGNGIRIPIIWFDSNSIPTNGTLPMLMHPPLFPVILALLGGVTSKSFFAAQIVNFICHVLTSFFSYLLMQNLIKNKGISLLVGILVSVSIPMLTAAHHLWSESLFIALITASIYFITIARHSRDYEYRRNLIIASICASAAVLTRNAGIAVIILFFFEGLVLLKNKRPELKYKSTMLALILPIIALTSLYVRNYMVSGLIRGHVEFIVDHSYKSALTGTIKMLFQQFLLGYRSSVLILSIAALFICYVAVNTDARKQFLSFFHSGLDVITVFTLSYTALIIIALAEKQPRFEVRFVFPLAPFLIIISVFAVVFICKMIKKNGLHKLSLNGMILSLCLISFVICYKTLLTSSEYFSKQLPLYNVSKSCTFAWLKNNIGNNALITTNKPYHLSFFGGYSTLRLPYRLFHETERIPEDMGSELPARMKEVGSEVIALFEPVEEQYYGSYVTSLFNQREDYNSLSLAHECANGVIYFLRK